MLVVDALAWRAARECRGVRIGELFVGGCCIDGGRKRDAVCENRERATVHLRESAIEEKDVGRAGALLDAQTAFAKTHQKRRGAWHHATLSIPSRKLDIGRVAIKDAFGGGNNGAAQSSHGGRIVRARPRGLKSLGGAWWIGPEIAQRKRVATSGDQSLHPRSEG